MAKDFPARYDFHNLRTAHASTSTLGDASIAAFNRSRSSPLL
jgi:hypothetical protein